MEFVMLVLGFAAGVVVGWALRVFTTKSRTGKIIKEEIVSFAKTVKEEIKKQTK